jgi:hypothetical protein
MHMNQDNYYVVHKVILQTDFAFIILFLLLRHFDAHSFNVYQVIPEEYILYSLGFNQSGVRNAVQPPMSEMRYKRTFPFISKFCVVLLFT